MTGACDTKMTYVRPRCIAEALDLLSRSDWRIIAGGTDFYPALRDRPVRDAVLDITALQDLKLIHLEDGFWRIGATVTWSDLLTADLPPAFNALKLAAREVGSVQIQNRATIVGNVCNASPAADGVPALLVLDATVELASRHGKRVLPLAEFIVGNRATALQKDELVTAILVPENTARGRSTFLKLGSRRFLVISIVMVACRLSLDAGDRIDSAAISVGACSAVAKRLARLESRLTGRAHVEAGSIAPSDADMQGLTPITDIRSTSQYRLLATKELVRRAIDTVVEEF